MLQQELLSGTRQPIVFMARYVLVQTAARLLISQRESGHQGVYLQVSSLLGEGKPGYLSTTNDSDPENHLSGQKDVKAYRNHDCEHAGNI